VPALPHPGPPRVAHICDAADVSPLTAAPPLVLAATLVAVLSGCGNGRLSHGDFVKRADAVCTAYRAAAGPIARPRSYPQIVAYVNKTLPLYEAARRKLAALKPPSKDVPTVRDWLAADRRVSAALRQLGEAGLRHDFAGVTAAAASIQAEGATSRQAAETLGLQVCSQP
jgi:hypothetical protein